MPKRIATAPAMPADLSAAQQRISELEAEKRNLEIQIKALKQKIDGLCRRLFGKKSEQLDPGQLQLALELAETEAGAPDAPEETDSGEAAQAKPKTRRAPKGVRTVEDLPVERVVNDVPESEKVCDCGQDRTKIGEDVTSYVDYVPSVFKRVEVVTPRYACPSGDHGVTAAPALEHGFAGGQAGPGLLAHTVTSKYAHHLPLYRLEEIFARQGLSVSRSTLCGWVKAVAEAVEPIHAELVRQVVSQDYLQTDDTPVVVLRERDGPVKGRVWAYVDPLGEQVAYDFTLTHEASGPETFLAPFRGYLQADAYTGYDRLYRNGRVTEVACWAHTRRRFFDSREADPIRANRMLSLIQKLYAIEHECAALTSPQRQRIRQEKARAVLDEIAALRDEYKAVVLPKSLLGEGLRYMTNQWTALNRYLEDGRLKIDNNNAERALRLVAVGRKNWMFAGSRNGGRWAVILYSLVNSCRMAGVDPFVYLRDVLVRVASHPASRVDELVPLRWKRLQMISAAPVDVTVPAA